MMVIFTFIFSETLQVSSGAIPYPVFVLAGLILWGLFSGGVSHAAESMIQHAGMIRKIYFPRLIIPCSAILTSLFDFIMAFVIFAVLCFWYGQHVSLSALYYFPAAIFLTLAAAGGAGTLLSALNVKYRDFRYVVPFMLQVLFFSAQVIYPLQSIPSATLRNVLALNPLNGAIELFRSPLSGTGPDWTVVLIGTAVTIVIAIAGLVYFRKTESYFADIA
jgi:lipopolysaccharide transport system permease protein